MPAMPRKAPLTVVTLKNGPLSNRATDFLCTDDGDDADNNGCSFKFLQLSNLGSRRPENDRLYKTSLTLLVED